MRILIDARMYGLEHTGIGRYLINLIEQLKRESSNSIETKHHFIILLRKKYFETLTFSKGWEKILVDIPHYGIREQLLLPGIIEKHKPDLVHFPHINVPIFYKGRYVVTVHDITMQKQGIAATKLPLPIYFLKRLPFLCISKFAVKNASKIIVPSKTTATNVANFYNMSIQKIVVIYEGFDDRISIATKYLNEIDVLSKYDLLNKDYFFYVGNAYPHKNLPIVIRAVKDLNENKNMHIFFVIAGLKDDFHQQLSDFVNDLGAGGHIKLVGYVKDEELAIIYRNSVGFVYPSLSEGFGLQTVEAMGLGVPVIQSNASCLPEVLADSAVYFNPDDEEEMLKKIGQLIEDKELREVLTGKGRENIKRFSWEKNVKETHSLYLF